MSRQRIRASVLESHHADCPHAAVLATSARESSVALDGHPCHRGIYCSGNARNHILVHTPASTALYILNHKRANLVDLEARFGPTITIEGRRRRRRPALTRSSRASLPRAVVIDTPRLDEIEEEEPFVEEEEDEDEVEQEVPHRGRFCRGNAD